MPRLKNSSLWFIATKDDYELLEKRGYKKLEVGVNTKGNQYIAYSEDDSENSPKGFLYHNTVSVAPMHH
ncbi:hypothetical protein H0H92_005620 [Tricholoma furcatifolium]|nr:hypothetical protein H0H92_005620 [Tricholoma furcatifolium]